MTPQEPDQSHAPNQPRREDSTQRVPIVPHHDRPTRRRPGRKVSGEPPEESGVDVSGPDYAPEGYPAVHVHGEELEGLQTWAFKSPGQPHPNDGSSLESSAQGSHPSRWQPSPERMPSIGEYIFGFRILQPLGEGSFAKVFLAEQADLAERQVVLKISRATGEEAQTLAQLQHTNIVPIYSLHEDKAAGLRALCMPYVGGASASAVLREFWQTAQTRTTGKELADALRAVSGPPPIRTTVLGGDGKASVLEAENPGRPDHSGATIDQQEHHEDNEVEGGPESPENCVPDFAVPANTPVPWERDTYVRAVVWIVARLARALQHAHDRGIMHRDIKPSNILFAADGEPMLLDFNISQRLTKRPHHGEGSDLSGTIAYMSPEHLRALALQDSALANQIGHRSDIYSLGLVFYEMIVGKHPFEEADTKHHASGGQCPGGHRAHPPREDPRRACPASINSHG